ncbi:SRPBCC family protein [Georgenia faecalis]|uniref:SRPBCC family protein n=1 Tax=Georgenia faecalis TaxID=2483799 RepID=UPI000FDB77AC|nr:SRPBCC family protein [Georgenia faecalis]
MGNRGIYVETTIAAPMERVWALTQVPDEHVRWDLRFTRIIPTTPTASGATRFTYTRRTPLRTVAGDGVSIGETTRPDGTRTSALRFSTDDRLSPIRSGRGYWRYVPDGGAVRFVTGYDYAPGWGPVLDRIARPALGWATAWSFDRLRIWAERDEPPERWPLRSVAWFWRPERPRASRCRRAPAHGRRRDDHLRDAPATLATLPAPEGPR